MDNEVVKRQRAVSDTEDRRSSKEHPHGIHAASSDVDCSPRIGGHEKESSSLSDDIARLWPRLEAGIRYLRNR